MIMLKFITVESLSDIILVNAMEPLLNLQIQEMQGIYPLMLPESLLKIGMQSLMKVPRKWKQLEVE